MYQTFKIGSTTLSLNSLEISTCSSGSAMDKTSLSYTAHLHVHYSSLDEKVCAELMAVLGSKLYISAMYA